MLSQPASKKAYEGINFTLYMNKEDECHQIAFINNSNTFKIEHIDYIRLYDSKRTNKTYINVIFTAERKISIYFVCKLRLFKYL